MKAYIIGSFLVLIAAIGGIFIGLSDWFDKLMKQIGDELGKINL